MYNREAGSPEAGSRSQSVSNSDQGSDDGAKSADDEDGDTNENEASNEPDGAENGAGDGDAGGLDGPSQRRLLETALIHRNIVDGRYWVTRLIGKGSYGLIFEVRHNLTRRLFAAKVEIN